MHVWLTSPPSVERRTQQHPWAFVWAPSGTGSHTVDETVSYGPSFILLPYCITSTPHFHFCFHFLSISPHNTNPLYSSPLLSLPPPPSCPLISSNPPALTSLTSQFFLSSLRYFPSSCWVILYTIMLHKILMLYLYVTEIQLILLIDSSVWSSKPTGTKWSSFFTAGSLTADGWWKVSWVFFWSVL